jgi:hypothetical protein
MTPKDIAQWMFAELERDGFLHHSNVVHKIATEFGKEFLRTNEGGNPVIDRRILREFRKLTE